MNHMLIPAAAVLLAAAAVIVLLRWRKAAAKTRQDREMIDRKLKEDALDRALSNGARRNSGSQTPVEVRYSSHPQREGGSMLRLTDQAESVKKEYLFQKTDVLYIGEEYGRSAVFREQGRNKLYCELFPYQDGVYVRLCGRAECRLIRGRQTAPLTETPIRLRSGDKIEVQTGVFLVELL